MSETIDINTTPESPSTALTVTIKAALPTILAADTNDILGKLFAEIDGWEGDGSTEDGRKECRSKARKVSIAMQDLLRLGKKCKEDAQIIVKGVIEEEKIIKSRMEALRDKVSSPADEYDARQKARIEAHTAALQEIADLGAAATPGMTSTEIGMIGEALAAMHADRDWEEFSARAKAARTTSRAALSAAYAQAKQRELDAAELDRLRAEAVERDRLTAIETQRLREEQIARDAAETARKAAEEKAATDAREAEERAQATLRAAETERARQAEEAAQRERDAAAALEALEKRRQESEARRERERVAAHERALESIGGMIRDACSPFNGSDMIRHITKIVDGMAETSRDWEEFADRAAGVIADGRKRIAERLEVVLGQEEEGRQKRATEAAEQAERDRIAAKMREEEAEKRAEAARIAAAQRAEQEKRAAIESERQRVAGEAARQKAEDDRRAANKAHQGSINRAVLTDIMRVLNDNWKEEDELSPEILARKIVEAIAKGGVAHTLIRY